MRRQRGAERPTGRRSAAPVHRVARSSEATCHHRNVSQLPRKPRCIEDLGIESRAPQWGDVEGPNLGLSGHGFAILPLLRYLTTSDTLSIKYLCDMATREHDRDTGYDLQSLEHPELYTVDAWTL